jgi:hypothetical protein
MSISLAHLGHYMWALYLPPVLIVLSSIIRTTLAQRREERREREGRPGP